METIQTREWVFLNRMIYAIYTTPDQARMRTQFLHDLHVLLDYDCAEFYLQDPACTDPHLCLPVFDQCDSDDSEVYQALDYSQDLMRRGKSMIYRESDYLPENERVRTEYYRKVYQPNKWHYALQMLLAYSHHFVGVVTLYRYIGKDDFTYDDIFLLDQVKDHLAYRLGCDTGLRQNQGRKMSVTQATEACNLTHQESVVLRYIMDGLENDEIADRLSITMNTLKKHTLNIYRKLGVSSRTQLFKTIREAE